MRQGRNRSPTAGSTRPPRSPVSTGQHASRETPSQPPSPVLAPPPHKATQRDGAPPRRHGTPPASRNDSGTPPCHQQEARPPIGWRSHSTSRPAWREGSSASPVGGPHHPADERRAVVERTCGGHSPPRTRRIDLTGSAPA